MGFVIYVICFVICVHFKKNSWYLLWRAQFEHQKKISWSIPKSFLVVLAFSFFIDVLLFMCWYLYRYPFYRSWGSKNIYSWRRRTHFEVLYFSDDLKTTALVCVSYQISFTATKNCASGPKSHKTSREANLRPGEVDTMTRRSGREGWEVTRYSPET